MKPAMRRVLVAVVAALVMAGSSGTASASVPAARVTDVCQARQIAHELKKIKASVWVSATARRAAVDAAFAKARVACVQQPYPVRIEARQGRDATKGILRVACRPGYDLSPADPPGRYQLTFGALDQQSRVAVTQTERTSSSYEVDYEILPETPAGGGMFLEGTCVPRPR